MHSFTPRRASQVQARQRQAQRQAAAVIIAMLALYITLVIFTV